MTPTRFTSVALGFIAMASAGAQQLPPVRQLGSTVAKSNESFITITAARQLAGGRVLVNDPVGRRVLMFDSTLTSTVIVADSTPTTSNAYSSRAGGLLPYRGDSALFVDAASVSMSVIDPSGKISRVISVPRSQDAMFLTGMTGGIPGFDAEGRLVYRGMLRPQINFSNTGTFVPPQPPDSAPLVRIDLATRKTDTVAYLKIPKNNMQVQGTPETGIRIISEMNPMPVVDDYAITADGAVALLRGQDYHVDWLQPNGGLTASPKVPFEWQRLTDEGKVAVIDSAKAAMESARTSANVTADRQAGMVAGMAAGAAMGGGGNRTTIIMGGPPGAGGGDGRGAAGMPGGFTPTFISPSELPDYRPAFGAGASRPDAEGNIWVRTSKFINGGPVYDVINRKGEVADRVVIPAGRQIVGFGKDGSVYLVVREGTVAKLERARVR